MSASQVALLGSGAALIYALRRWRKIAAAKQPAGGGDTGGPALAESPRAPLAASICSNSGVPRSALNVRELTTEVQALLTEVEETARRAAAQVDNRYRKLEQLVVEADEKIKRLEGLLTQAPAPAVASPVRPAERPAVMGGAELLNRLRQERGAPAPAEDPAYRPIYQLADAGRNAREIAQELGRQPGEVELILALRGRSRV